MKNYYLQMQTCSLLLLLFLFAFCNGQVKKDLPAHSLSKSKTITAEQLKIVKTQDSGKADNIHCGLQDKAGNLWFGTTGEGVYRYNGKSFTQFTVKDGLSNNTVWSVLEDKAGNIWFGTADGICRYNGKNIIRIPITVNFMPGISNNNYQNDLSAQNEVWSMLQDKSGKIWFGTTDGVYCFNGKFFTHFLHNDNVINKEGLHLKMVDCILQDKHGIIWFASGMPPGMEGICRYDGKAITGSKPNGDGWIRTITEDKDGAIWFAGRRRGNFFYDGKTFTNFTEKAGIGNAVLADKSGNIWFTGEEENDGFSNKGGIWCYDGKTFKNFTTKDGLGNYFVWCMIEDRNGNIWAGTRNTGLYRYDGKTFTSFSE